VSGARESGLPPDGIVAFIRARLDEDEDAARAAGGQAWTWDGGLYATHPTDEVVDYVYGDNGPHIARHHPAHVLAEVEALRRVVDECEEVASMTQAGFIFALRVVRLLAAIWRSHPSYDPAWAPEEART
jgi:hypothetical protein